MATPATPAAATTKTPIKLQRWETKDTEKQDRNTYPIDFAEEDFGTQEFPFHIIFLVSLKSFKLFNGKFGGAAADDGGGSSSSSGSNSDNSNNDTEQVVKKMPLRMNLQRPEFYLVVFLADSVQFGKRPGPTVVGCVLSTCNDPLLALGQPLPASMNPSLSLASHLGIQRDAKGDICDVQKPPDIYGAVWSKREGFLARKVVDAWCRAFGSLRGTGQRSPEEHIRQELGMRCAMERYLADPSWVVDPSLSAEDLSMWCCGMLWTDMRSCPSSRADPLLRDQLRGLDEWPIRQFAPEGWHRRHIYHAFTVLLQHEPVFVQESTWVYLIRHMGFFSPLSRPEVLAYPPLPDFPDTPPLTEAQRRSIVAERSTLRDLRTMTCMGETRYAFALRYWEKFEGMRPRAWMSDSFPIIQDPRHRVGPLPYRFPLLFETPVSLASPVSSVAMDCS